MDVIISVHEQEIGEWGQIVSEGLDSFNAAVAPLHEVNPLSCFARLGDGTVIGGAIGRTWGECCELTELWVHEGHRRNRVGRRLLEEFHWRAESLNCSVFYLTTFSFQAPEFYASMGYKPVAEVSGFSGGIAKYTMVRRTKP